jgi:hypothetical protein
LHRKQRIRFWAAIADSNVELTNFGVACLTNAPQLVSPPITLGRGSHIAKTKLSVRKAEKRPGKKGQEGREEAAQTPAGQSIRASSGNEVSQS